MKAYLIAAGLMMAIAPVSRAQSGADSSAVMGAVLSHMAARPHVPIRTGVAPQTFTPNRVVNGRATGFRWNLDSRPRGIQTAIAAHPAKLRTAVAFDSVPRKCVSIRPEPCRQFRDYDAMIGLSEPGFDGPKAVVDVQYLRNAAGDAPNGPFDMEWYRYVVELSSGQWIVVQSTLLFQT
jgi:hypothetical protein